MNCCKNHELQRFQTNGRMSNVYTNLSTIRDIGVVKSPLVRRFGIVTSLCFLSFYLVIIFQTPSQTELVQNGKAPEVFNGLLYPEGTTYDDDVGGIDFTLGTIQILLEQNYFHFTVY
jgi:hypothetical protein